MNRPIDRHNRQMDELDYCLGYEEGSSQKLEINLENLKDFLKDCDPSDLDKCLIRASNRNCMDIAATLLKIGANPTNKNADDETAISYAKKNGRHDFVSFCLSNNNSCISNESPLYVALKAGDIEAVLMELERRPDNVNTRNKSGDTPLHIALDKDFTELAKALIKQGADPLKKNVAGVAPLDIMTSEKYNPVFELDLIKFNCSHVNMQNQQGNTPLHEALSKKNIEHAEIYLKHGADISIRNKLGKTALDICLEQKWEYGVNFLIKKNLWEKTYFYNVLSFAENQQPKIFLYLVFLTVAHGCEYFINTLHATKDKPDEIIGLSITFKVQDKSYPYTLNKARTAKINDLLKKYVRPNNALQSGAKHRILQEIEKNLPKNDKSIVLPLPEILTNYLNEPGEISTKMHIYLENFHKEIMALTLKD